MKVVCVCFGGYTEVIIRSSPFDRADNVTGSLQNHSSIDIEHTIYNGKFFKIKGSESYIIMWLRTEIGLIDYQIDRGTLKTFSKVEVPDIITVMTDKINTLILDDAKINEHQSVTITRERTNRKTKKERIPATVRNIVWVTHFQASKKGQCWLCKVEDISSANFECGHVISEKNGGKPTIDNLRPICGFCNKSVGTMNMEDFKRKYNIP